VKFGKNSRPALEIFARLRADLDEAEGLLEDIPKVDEAEDLAEMRARVTALENRVTVIEGKEQA
jgi:hypothetical protein